MPQAKQTPKVKPTQAPKPDPADAAKQVGVLGETPASDAPAGVLAGGTVGGGETEGGARVGVPEGGSAPGVAEPSNVVFERHGKAAPQNRS